MPLLETAVPALNVVWFLLIAVLWIGFFFLEGFDFGVAMLLPVLGRNDKERRVMVNTIGPTWDGNEVWLLTAGGATFAAFPGWYATLFSGLYLPLLLVLVGLILRGVAFEYRSKHPDAKWRNMFDVFATYGSLTAALVLGVGFANFAIGLANDGKLWNGSFFGLFGPFALLGGVLFVALFMVHGATFLALKSRGEIHDRARGFVRTWGWPVVGLLAVFVVCQHVFWRTRYRVVKQAAVRLHSNQRALSLAEVVFDDESGALAAVEGDEEIIADAVGDEAFRAEAGRRVGKLVVRAVYRLDVLCAASTVEVVLAKGVAAGVF
mgnify:CR=1 FL=1